MILDILSDSNVLSFNIKAAKLFGLTSSIYLSAVVRLCSTSSVKTTKDTITFELDRKFIQDLTTLTSTEQRVIETRLTQLEILEVSESTGVLKLRQYATLLLEEDKDILAEVAKIGKPKAKLKMTAREKTAFELKNQIICSNPELLEALKGWVDGVYANPKGFLSIRSISVFQKTLEDFARGNLTLVLKLVEIATIHGHRDAQWTLAKFQEDNPKAYKEQLALINSVSTKVVDKPKVSSKVF